MLPLIAALAGILGKLGIAGGATTAAGAGGATGIGAGAVGAGGAGTGLATALPSALPAAGEAAGTLPAMAVPAASSALPAAASSGGGGLSGFMGGQQNLNLFGQGQWGKLGNQLVSDGLRNKKTSMSEYMKKQYPEGSGETPTYGKFMSYFE